MRIRSCVSFAAEQAVEKFVRSLQAMGYAFAAEQAVEKMKAHPQVLRL